LDPLRDLEASEQVALKELDARADAAAGRFDDGFARSGALLVKARILGLLGDRRAAHEILERAVAAAPANPGSNVQAILATGRRLQLAEQRGRDDALDAGIPGTLADSVALARSRSRDVLDQEGRGLCPPSAGEVEQVLRCEAAFAAFEGDRPACAEAAGKALEGLRRRDGCAAAAEIVAHLKRLRRWAAEGR
jgi:hypothetical protein